MSILVIWTRCEAIWVNVLLNETYVHPEIICEGKKNLLTDLIQHTK